MGIETRAPASHRGMVTDCELVLNIEQVKHGNAHVPANAQYRAVAALHLAVLISELIGAGKVLAKPSEV